MKGCWRYLRWIMLLGVVLVGVALFAPKAPVDAICQSEQGKIACEHFGADRVQEASDVGGIVRIVYKWNIISNPAGELGTQNRRIVRAICDLREAGFDQGNYRIQAQIDVSDASGNITEEGGIGVTIEQPAIQALNCANQDRIDLAAVSSYALNDVIR